jgi:phage-related protein
MYRVIMYETDSGNKPLEKFLKELTRDHKVLEIAKIWFFINNLEKYGWEIKKWIPGSIKKLRNELWELKPGKNRILFFYSDKMNCFVLLHGFCKKTNKTPQKEIDLGEQEIKGIEGRPGNGKI